MTHFQNSQTALAQVASSFADTIVRVVQQEYPNQMQHMMTGPDDRPTPREAHPAFYGCFDWHSSVEMHWVLIRLLRLVPEAFDTAKAMTVLNAHLTEEALSQEAAYLRSRPRFERPYGWGWYLTFVHELTLSEDETTAQWLKAARRQHLEAGMKAHANASMSAVTGSDYMVEHWLAAFAMLYISGV